MQLQRLEVKIDKVVKIVWFTKPRSFIHETSKYKFLGTEVSWYTLFEYRGLLIIGVYVFWRLKNLDKFLNKKKLNIT